MPPRIGQSRAELPGVKDERNPQYCELLRYGNNGFRLKPNIEDGSGKAVICQGQRLVHRLAGADNLSACLGPNAGLGNRQYVRSPISEVLSAAPA